MNRRYSFALVLIMLLAGASILSACGTTAGVGQDLSAAGQALKDSAEKHKP